MGYTANWSPVTSTSHAVREHTRGHRAYSAYTVDVLEGRASRQVHERMDPKGVTRESRDSLIHPESLAIATFFDVTGSMGTIPRELQRRLVSQMTLLTTRGYVDHPQQFFGAIGDATCDTGPLQTGQFEVGLEMDDDLERVWVESGGGGQTTESYELAYYFTARHMQTDCWEKRQKKGYLFTMGDESPYLTISAAQVRRLIGDTLQADISTADIVAEVSQRWNPFHLLVETSTSQSKPSIKQTWEGLLPAGHVIELKDPKNVAEIIALIVGICEGKVTNVSTELGQLGADGAAVAAVMTALNPFVAARGIRLND